MKWLIPFPCKECGKGSRCWHGETCVKLMMYLHIWLIAVRAQMGFKSSPESEEAD